MAVTYVTGSVENDLSGASLSINPPSGLAEHDGWIIVVMETDTSCTIDTPSGWLAISDQVSNFAQKRAFIKPDCGASESAVTVTVTNGSGAACAMSIRVSGQYLTDPRDAHNETIGGFSSTIDAADITVAQVGSLAILWAGNDNPGLTVTVPSGSTDPSIHATASFTGLWLAYESRNAGSYAPGNWTFSGSGDDQTAQTFSIKPVPPTVDQDGFRFRSDDGSETTATWAAAQDANITSPLGSNLRLRFLLQATDDPTSGLFTLRKQKNGAGGYTAVPVGTTYKETPVIEAADATESGNNTASSSWTTVAFPNASTGDLLICCISWDDSTATTSVTPPSGPNGETFTAINSTPATDASTETRSQCWYTVATGSWTAGNLTFTPSASEQWTAAVIRVPAGEFDASTPIGASATNGAAGTAEQNIQCAGSWSAGASDGSGKFCVWTSADDDPQTVAADFTQIANTDRGAVSGGFFTRDVAVVDSEAFVAKTVSTIASDSWSTVAFIVRAPTLNSDVYVATSGNITAGGEATTSQLSGGTGSFTTGRMWDNENGSDSINIGNDGNTELEWCLQAQSPAVNGDYYDFRVYKGSAALDAYTVTPRWTIGSSVVFDWLRPTNLPLLGLAKRIVDHPFVLPPWNVYSTIIFDQAGDSGYQADTGDYTFNRTVSSNSNRYIDFAVSSLGLGTTVTAVTDDNLGTPVAATFIGAQGSGTSRIEFWRVVAPAVGTKQVRVQLSESLGSSVTTYASYYNVNQTVPTEAFNSNSGFDSGAGVADVTVTSVSNKCVIRAAIATDDGSVTADQTSRSNVSGAAGSTADEDFGPQSPGAKSMTYSGIGTGSFWAMIGYALRPVDAETPSAMDWHRLLSEPTRFRTRVAPY